ncbi:uncharacterized protein DUF742 [Herbihabitans rhizosphaerae]|uniref:Uncharacterized protein DUF742 n=1 Tax=Herbihabitans rhizosphaerae TaxID=1872711 RepID=A0A4Q7KJA9_9PSEU|nr:DUF742 domain-containing protein [Herbihabitans rhizosphaerae]RZS33956.1 uncharacterized protein DUF742 [Herbihabitans rhizosphaerae]
MKHGRESWYDDEAGPLVRPYTVTRGRTRSGHGLDLDMITLVVSNASGHTVVDPEYAQILRMCRYPLSIAEVSAKLGLPLAVIKILIADLIEDGLLIFRSPPSPLDTETPDMDILQAVLDGIRRL